MALPTGRDTVETVQDLGTLALRKLFVVEGHEVPADEDAARALENTRMLLRTWAVNGIRLWLNEQQSVTLVAGQASYTLDPRTLEVFDAYRSQGNTDSPMRILTREEYNSLPNKTVTGQPYALWPDRRYNSTVITVYPVPQTGTTDTLSLGTKRQILDPVSLGENVEMPPEWSEAIVYNLAVRMAPDFGVEPEPFVVSMAGQLYADLSGQDREGSVKFRLRRR